MKSIIQSTYLKMSEDRIEVVEKQQGDFKSSTFLKAWNIVSAAGVLLPLIVFMWARITSENENQYYGDDADREYQEFKNCDGEEQSWWKYWCHGDDQAWDEDRDVRAPWWCKYMITKDFFKH